MVKFHTIGQIEKKYAFTDAVANADTVNGAFGDIASGKFSAGAAKSKAIMLLEVGDEAGLDTYPIKKGTRVRVIDLTKFNGETIEIYGAQLPATIAKDDKLVSKADGTLEVKNGSAQTPTAAPYFTVTKVIPNTKGVEVTVVTE